MFFIYRILINLIILFSPLIVLVRIIKNKEDKFRFKEKFCFFSKKRGNGKLIWFHGSSVGEILSVIPLIEKLEKKKKIDKILVTSSTLSSSKVLSQFKLKKTIHQFFPIDSNFIINRFLNYWKPSSVFFIESEIWPNAIINIKNRNIKLILLNGRITKKTFKKWKKIENFSKSLFSKFDISISQNDETKIFLKKLGAKKIKKDSISIIIPRHVNRVLKIKNDLEKIGLKVYLHSSNTKPKHKFDIYLVDTYGETKSFFKICNVVFLGKSFKFLGLFLKFLGAE